MSVGRINALESVKVVSVYFRHLLMIITQGVIAFGKLFSVLGCFFFSAVCCQGNVCNGKRFGPGLCNVVISGFGKSVYCGGLYRRGNFTKQSHLLYTPTSVCVGPDNDIYRCSCTHDQSKVWSAFPFF